MCPSPQIAEKSALGSKLLMRDHIQEKSVAVERGLSEVPRGTRAKGVSQTGHASPATAIGIGPSDLEDRFGEGKSVGLPMSERLSWVGIFFAARIDRIRILLTSETQK